MIDGMEWILSSSVLILIVVGLRALVLSNFRFSGELKKDRHPMAVEGCPLSAYVVAAWNGDSLVPF